MFRNVWFRLFLGLALSGLIAVSVNSYLQSLKDEVEVVVAAQIIPAQMQITSAMLKTIRVNLASQQLLTPNAIHNVSSLVGFVAMDTIKEGEVIANDPRKIFKFNPNSTEKMSTTGEVGKAYFIPADKRAITVRLDAEGGLAFGLKRGDKVDVIFTSVNTETGGAYSTTLFQKIEVFEVEASGDKAQGNNMTLQNVTLVVNPQEAQDLTLAKRKGKIDLILESIHAKALTNKTMRPSFPENLQFEEKKK